MKRIAKKASCEAISLCLCQTKEENIEQAKFICNLLEWFKYYLEITVEEAIVEPEPLKPNVKKKKRILTKSFSDHPVFSPERRKNTSHNICDLVEI